MPNKINFEEAKERIYKVHGNNIELLEYIKFTDPKSKFLCKNIDCNYIWYTSAKSVANGCGCKLCGFKKSADSNRHTVEYIRIYLKNFNCELINNNYINNEIPIMIKFECGHIYSIRFGGFVMGRRCPICAKEKVINFHKLSFEEILNDMKEHNLEFIDFPNGYKNVESHIRYVCENGHITDKMLMSFRRSNRCKLCVREERRQAILGKGHHNWKGTGKLRVLLMKDIGEWKKESMKNCDYKCVITHGSFTHIHHLYSFNKIINEALIDLGLIKKVKTGDYSQEELLSIVSKVQELHKKYPLGICLRKDVHRLFHKIYSTTNFTPENFYDFKQKIDSGEITI